MAKKKVIVKRLASIQNLGSMNILCSDKTGTLTTGQIILENACNIEGTSSDKVLLYACLNATYQSGYTNPIDMALKGKVAKDEICAFLKLDEIPYDFIRKRLSILVKNGDNTPLMITKGAFQQIMNISSHAEIANGNLVGIEEVRNQLTKQFSEFCNSGYRVLGLCYKGGHDITAIRPENETEMTFLGFLLLSDPLKADAGNTIARLKNLGIDLKIITGDNKLAAMHAARLIVTGKEAVLTGPELRNMSDQALLHRAKKSTIFAEIEPNQKERIILALRKSGNVVGFLGDGINDVTALHAADVSITVDSAADAAKEVADIVLLEKDLSVLEDGVKAGRMTFANTMKYVFMATSANFGNMFSMAGASLFLPFLPLLPKQVLLTNLLTDFPEMTIATDNVDQTLIEKPMRWNIVFIYKFMMVFGLISSIFDYATFGALLLMNASVGEFRTGWFLESVVSATLIVLVIRTFRPFYTSRPSKSLLLTALLIISATALLPFSPLAPILGFTLLPKMFYLFISVIVLLYIFCVELAKRFILQRWISKKITNHIL